jgi:ABC-2 type transport system ATP-binding protein
MTTDEHDRPMRSAASGVAEPPSRAAPESGRHAPSAPPALEPAASTTSTRADEPAARAVSGAPAGAEARPIGVEQVPPGRDPAPVEAPPVDDPDTGPRPEPAEAPGIDEPDTTPLPEPAERPPIDTPPDVPMPPATSVELAVGDAPAPPTVGDSIAADATQAAETDDPAETVPDAERATSDRPAARRAGTDRANAVEVENVSRRFGKELVVDGVSFNVPTGSILGLIGPSGAGKTTIIRMLTGALEPTHGAIRVLGEEPRHLRRATRERIGYMPQLFSLWRDLSAKDNVDFVASLFGMLYPSRRRRTREVLELVELWDARDRRTADLSGGMQRRLELACMLVHDPTLALLDEPTAGIDPILRGAIWDELQRRKDDGNTLLVTTQYVNEAEECDLVALLSDGRLVALEPPDELRRMATEGDIVELETTTPFEGRRLSRLDGIRGIKQVDRRHIRLTVADAAAATPTIVDAVTEHGGDVRTVRESRPSFDDVFATLVERDRRENGNGNGRNENGAGKTPTVAA